MAIEVYTDRLSPDYPWTPLNDTVEDLANVLGHEAGHLFSYGFSHSLDPSSIMYWQLDRGVPRFFLSGDNWALP